MAKYPPLVIEESEWLTGIDLSRLLRHVYPTASDRKLRLFTCTCCAVLRPHYSDPNVIRALDLAEQWADGSVARSVLNSARRAAGWSNATPYVGVSTHAGSANVAVHAANLATWPRRGLESGAGWNALFASRELGLLPDRNQGWVDEHHANLFRDIFGNPFRPVAFDPAWRTSDSTGIAAKMYESREFSAMPILADALEEAGCDNTDILLHCRMPGTHIRGCWVVDLVLDKN